MELDTGAHRRDVLADLASQKAGELTEDEVRRIIRQALLSASRHAKDTKAGAKRLNGALRKVGETNRFRTGEWKSNGTAKERG